MSLADQTEGGGGGGAVKGIRKEEREEKGGKKREEMGAYPSPVTIRRKIGKILPTSLQIPCSREY